MNVRDARLKAREQGVDLVGASVRLVDQQGLWTVRSDHGDTLLVGDPDRDEQLWVSVKQVDYVAALSRTRVPLPGTVPRENAERLGGSVSRTKDGQVLQVGDWVEALSGGYLDGLGGLGRVEAFLMVKGSARVSVRGGGRAHPRTVDLKQLKKVMDGEVVEEARLRHREGLARRKRQPQVVSRRQECPVCGRRVTGLGKARRCSPHKLPYTTEGVMCPMSGRLLAVLTDPRTEEVLEVSHEKSSSVRAFGGGLPTLGRRSR